MARMHALYRQICYESNERLQTYSKNLKGEFSHGLFLQKLMIMNMLFVEGTNFKQTYNRRNYSNY
jgi:hypothetical protein